MAQFLRQFISVEDYLRDEQAAKVKHDYFNGQVYNMSGGSPEHSRIAINLTSELRALLRGKGCQMFNSDLKVAIPGNVRAKGTKRQPDDELVTYPDASVVCGELEFYKDDRQTLANPTVIFEVLSPSTRNYDQITKLQLYRKIPGLQAYIMVDSEKLWVEQYVRTGEISWQVDDPLESRADNLYVAALDITIPLADIYESIVFEDETNP